MSRALLASSASTAPYTLSLHDALPICLGRVPADVQAGQVAHGEGAHGHAEIVEHLVDLPGQGALEHQGLGLAGDRKSTRLNSSHQIISYAVFCLKKKTNTQRLRKHAMS